LLQRRRFTMLLASIRFRSQPHKRAEVISAVDTLIERMRRTTGCSGSRLLTEAEDENALTVISEWRSIEDVESFLQSRDFLVFKGIRMLLRGEPVLVFDQLQGRVTRVLHA
jgi:quinol monooxygenase YgiN